MASGLDSAIGALDTFSHMRIINGMGISLCLSRLLVFASRFIQNPKKNKLSYIHSGWVIVVFLWIIQFWWDYLLEGSVKKYDVATYILDLSYVFGLFFICVTLTPDDVGREDGDYEGYFFSRRIWFFWLFIFLNAIQFLSDLRINLGEKDTVGAAYDVIIFLIETAGILAMMRIRQRDFQFVLIGLLVLGVVTDFVMQ